MHATVHLPTPWLWSGWGRGAGLSVSPLHVAPLNLLQLCEMLFEDGDALSLEVLALRFAAGQLAPLLVPAALNVLAHC